MAYTSKYMHGGGSGKRWSHYQPQRANQRSSHKKETNEDKLYDGIERDPAKVWVVKVIGDLVSENADKPVNVTSRRVIASYNWDEHSWRPKIIVPGAPKEFHEWAGGNLSRHFNEDMTACGDRDHAPLRIMEAIFSAIRVCSPEFKVSDFDLILSTHALSGLYYIALKVVQQLREASNLPSLPNLDAGGRNRELLRIDVQVIGSTLLMVRKETEWHFKAGGVGPAFQRACAKAPPEAMMTPNQNARADDLSANPCNFISEITFGGIKIVLASEVHAAQYPSAEQAQRAARVYKMPTNLGVDVTIAGFVGDPNTLSPIPLSSLTTSGRGVFYPEKWIHFHYLHGLQFHYLGQHWKGIFEDAPNFKTVPEIEELCGLYDMTKACWVKALNHILAEVIGFARQYQSDSQLRAFSLVVDPKNGRFGAYDFDRRARGTDIDAISNETMQYLVSTL